MEDWFNRAGLTLQFISLFLVTPEIVGKERINRALGGMRAVSSNRTAVLLIIYFVVLAVGVSIFKAYQSGNPDLATSTWVTLGFTIATLLIVAGMYWAWFYIAKSERSLFPAGAALFATGYALLIAATFHPG